MTDISELGAQDESPSESPSESQHGPQDGSHDGLGRRPDDPPDRRRPGRRGLAVLAAVLFVLLVAGIAFAAVMATKVHSFDQQQRDRADAVAVAEQFTRRMDNYDTAHFDRYTKSVSQLLTTKARTDFDAQYKSYQQQLSQGRSVSSTGKVLMTGVGDSDSDSATVLVVHDVTAKSGKATVVHHYRWTVSMVKVNGRWLVDDFSSVS